MARPAPRPEAASRKRSSSPRESQPDRQQQRRSQSSEPLRSTMGAGTGGLTRSWSSTEPQFPAQWGGHGHMPKPPGSPAAYPLAVTRHCADTPACQHPPPHPGAHSMKPAKTRSMAAFALSHTAAFMTPSPQPVALPHWSPTTPPPRRPPLADRSSADEDVTLATAATDGVTVVREQDPMIKRLGHFMALLGPRYKCCSKGMIWEQAERGERTPAQRRLHKLGGIEAVGGGPDRLLKSSSAPGDLSNDPDGRARAAWLAARTTERDRRSRLARGLT